MKIEKFVFDQKYNHITNIKNSIVLQAITYGKIYELLHKQLWRKMPSRVWTYINPFYLFHLGRPVIFIRGWNIKSYAKTPYSYGGGDHTFGLNQLFMGQDYRKEYIGDPKGGIYHDDCFIQPKMIKVTSGEIKAWCYYSNAVTDYETVDGETWEYITTYTYDATKYYVENVDSNGQNIILNAVYETYMDGTIQKHRVIQTNANGSTNTIELGEKTDVNSGIHFDTTKKIINVYKTYTYHFSLTGHGAVLHQENVDPKWDFSNMGEQGWIKVYEDGTVVEYSPSTIDSFGDTGTVSPAHYKILPMMYTDTGDLVMDRVEFVEKWNDYFELIVREDGEWWQSFVKPIMAIITIVVAVYTGIIFNPIGAIGTGLSVIGTLGDDKNLSLIGGIMMAGAGIYNAIEEGFGKSLMHSGILPDRAEVIIQNATFTDMFKGYVSSAGLGNWANIGSKAFSIGSNIDTFASLSDVSTHAETATTETKRSMVQVKDEQEFLDHEECIKNVIQI